MFYFLFVWFYSVRSVKIVHFLIRRIGGISRRTTR
nr:MAG TPA: hypothetical protein [Caudoviricetes sp.]